MKHFHTFTKRAILGLTALTVALALLVSAACSGNEMNPTPPTDRGDQTLVEKIYQLNKEIANLREEVEELRSMEERAPRQGTDQSEPATSRPGPTPETTHAGQTAATEPTPTQVAFQTPTDPGICGRSPEIQKAILDSLDAPLCQVITSPELFRITGISEMRMDTVRAGDFQGLVNITELKVTAKDIEPGAFSGMENLEEMELTLYTNGSIAPRALQGLNNLERLKINTSKPHSEMEETLTLTELDHLPKLHTLGLDDGLGARILLEEIPHSFLQNLPALEHLEMEISGHALASNTENHNKLRLSEELFENNKALKVLKISSSIQDIELHIAEGIFRSTPLLKEVRIKNINMLKIPRDTFQNLEELEILAIGQFREEGEWKDHKIVLSEVTVQSR